MCSGRLKKHANKQNKTTATTKKPTTRLWSKPILGYKTYLKKSITEIAEQGDT